MRVATVYTTSALVVDLEGEQRWLDRFTECEPHVRRRPFEDAAGGRI
jgi:hypothetical protein